MNIITTSDVKKFLKLLQAGLKQGDKKELKTYTHGTMYDDTPVVREYFVKLDFSFTISREVVDDIFAEEDFDASEQLKDLLKDI